MEHTEKYGFFTLSGWRKSLLIWANRLNPGWFSRRLALILRKIVISSLPKSQKCIDSEISGIKIRANIRDNVSERKFLFMPHFFDPFERKFIQDNLPQDGVFLDIGANAGIYSMTAAQSLSDQGRVLSIEPHPEMVRRLSYNFKINNWQDKCNILQYAISDKEDTLSLILDDSNMGGSSLTLKRGDNMISVPCMPLKNLLEQEQVNNVHFLKIDIEGAEDKALIPFFNTAPDNLWPHYLIMERSPDQWEGDLESVLEKCGYQKLESARMNDIWLRNTA